MMQQSVVLLLLAIVLTAQAETTYMYVFAQEWPGSVCKTQKCTKAYMGNFDARRWNIHGLWPNTVLATSCGQISTCTSEIYDPSKLTAATTTAVNLSWNGLYSSSDSFRKHEWEKHGTCYPGTVTQNYYFSLATGMAENYNYYEIMGKSGIYPDDDRQLTDSVLRAAFSNVLGSSATINYTCAKDANNYYYLAELRVCFTQALKPRTCNCSKPVGAFVTCGKLFYYPTYKLTE